MKKKYMKPALHTSDIREDVSLLAGSPQSPWIDAKEQAAVEEDDFFAENEGAAWGETNSPSIWDDEEE